MAIEYERLTAWIADQGPDAVGPPMEAYLNDPGDVPPEECLTEVMVPVERARRGGAAARHPL